MMAVDMNAKSELLPGMMTAARERPEIGGAMR